MTKNSDILIPKANRFQTQKPINPNVSYIDPEKVSDFSSRLHKGPAMSRGTKFDFTKPFRNNPGVGEYQLPSIWSKYWFNIDYFDSNTSAIIANHSFPLVDCSTKSLPYRYRLAPGRFHATRKDSRLLFLPQHFLRLPCFLASLRCSIRYFKVLKRLEIFSRRWKLALMFCPCSLANIHYQKGSPKSQIDDYS